jgi:hypothetical protein
MSSYLFFYTLRSHHFSTALSFDPMGASIYIRQPRHTDRIEQLLTGPQPPLSSMRESLDKKVGEWRDADDRARAVEKAISRMPFFRGEGPPPTDDLVTTARSLRKVANEKLKAAIAAIKPEA